MTQASIAIQGDLDIEFEDVGYGGGNRSMSIESSMQDYVLEDGRW